MRKSMCAVVGVALLCVAPVLAQKSPDVCQISTWKVKPGAGAAWAEGRKKHMEFHKQQKDAFGWYTWEVINGDRAGNFITGTFDHYWKDRRRSATGATGPSTARTSRRPPVLRPSRAPTATGST